MSDACCCFAAVQVYTCEQVLSYLRQFVSAEKTAVEEKKELEAPAPGMKLLAKKGDSDADSLFTGMGGKKGKGARKAAEKAHKAVETVKVNGAAAAHRTATYVHVCAWQFHVLVFCQVPV